MQFIKAGQTAESNIFNRLDERKRALIAGGADVINLCPSARPIFSRTHM